jgi:hypothetical protein
MPLSPAEQDYRRNKVTGSLVNELMAATTEAALIKLWRVKVGLDPPQPEKLSQTAHASITRRGEIVDHPTVRDVCCKLDGYRAADNRVIEVKFLASWRVRDEFIPYFYPQVCLQMMCAGTSSGSLVVAQGTSEPVEHDIEFDAGYAAEMMRRVEVFLHCMRTLTPPYPEPPIYPPEKWRTIDVIESPTNWSVQLLEYLDEYSATADAAKQHDDAGKFARALIPDDVGKCFAGRFLISRNKNGVLTITTRRAA